MMQALIKLDHVEEAEALLTACRAFAEGGATLHQRVYFYEIAAMLGVAGERFEESRALWRKLKASAVEMKSLRTAATALDYQTQCEGYVGAFSQAVATAERWRAYVIDNGLFGETRQYLDLNLAYVYEHLGHTMVMRWQRSSAPMPCTSPTSAACMCAMPASSRCWGRSHACASTSTRSRRPSR